MLNRKLVEAALTLELGGEEPNVCQKVMLDAFFAYQERNTELQFWSDYSNPPYGLKWRGIPEPLMIGLGFRQGTTSVHRAIKKGSRRSRRDSFRDDA